MIVSKFATEIRYTSPRSEASRRLAKGRFDRCRQAIVITVRKRSILWYGYNRFIGLAARRLFLLHTSQRLASLAFFFLTSPPKSSRTTNHMAVTPTTSLTFSSLSKISSPLIVPPES